jgi:hyperosmotically inducible protein
LRLIVNTENNSGDLKVKIAKFFAVLLTSVILAGCAGTGKQSTGGDKAAAVKVDNATLATNVQSAIAADDELKGAKISTTAADGAVTLKGEVKTLLLRRKAESIAKGIPGVKSVNNRLVVTG